MKIPEDFIEITNKKSVERILGQIYYSRKYLTAWQQQGEESVNTIGFLLDYQRGQEHIEFKSMEIKEDLGFSKGKHLFLHNDFKSTIFKSKIKKQTKKKITLDFPSSLKIEQTRKNNRTRLGLNSNQYLKLTLRSEEGEKIHIDAQILDYSFGGVGFIIPIEYAPLINLSLIAEIGRSNITEVSQRHVCIRSMSPIENILTGKKFLRVGCEFTEKEIFEAA